jgi:hypothetical protein
MNQIVIAARHLPSATGRSCSFYLQSFFFCFIRIHRLNFFDPANDFC